MLAQGELGIAYNGDVVATIRIGNGAATWTQLPDFGGNGDLTQAAADLLYATLAQGELADTAVQPGDLPTFGDVVTHNASEFATAAQGTDARTPTAHAASHATAGTDPLTLAQSQVTGLTSDLAAKVGTSDPRLTDPRTPTSHAASHAAAGADPLTVAQSQVTNLGTDLAAKVPTSRTIAGLGLDADRSSADLKTALTLVKGDVGLGNVDNTADADKPVSTLQAAADSAAVAAAASDATTKADAKVADAINDGTTTVAPSQNAVFDALALKQPLDTDLTQIAAATFLNDDFVQKKSGSLTNRTIAQVKTDLGIVDTVADGVLSGQLVLPGVYIFGQVNAAIAANYVYAHPFVVRSPRTVSGLRIYVHTAASGKFARLGIINVDTGWQSAIAPIIDAGAVTVGSTGEQTATFSTITLQPGRYCTVLVSDGAPTLNFLLGPSFAGIRSSESDTAVAEFSAAMTYGAFPTPWNISLTANYGIGGGRWAVRLVP